MSVILKKGSRLYHLSDNKKIEKINGQMFFSVSPLGTIFMRPPSDYGDGYETNLQQHLYVLTLVEDVSLAWNPYKNKENLDYIQYYDGRISLMSWILLAGLKNILDENRKTVQKLTKNINYI